MLRTLNEYTSSLKVTVNTNKTKIAFFRNRGKKPVKTRDGLKKMRFLRPTI